MRLYLEGSALTIATLHDVAEERRLQDEKWGPVQSIPNGTGPCTGRAFGVYRELLEEARLDNDEGEATFESVLAEEFCEAMLEDDPVKLRAELVQVAAVAVKWIEHIDRRAP